MEVSERLVLETGKDTTLLDVLTFLKENRIKRVELVPVFDNEDMENAKFKMEIEDSEGEIDHLYELWSSGGSDTL